MAKKLAIITGGNAGLGYNVVKSLLATSQWKTVVACRDVSRGNSAADSLRKEVQVVGEDDLHVGHCDMADLSSVGRFVADIQSRYSKLDLLVCNAGLIPPKLTKTKDGNELTFQACHLGHFMLTLSLLPLLEASSQARIVVVSSDLHRKAGPATTPQDLNNLTDDAAFKPMEVYSTAKLYNVWFVKQLAKQLPSHVQVVAVTPGWVPTTQLGRFASWPAQLVMKYVMSLLPMTVSISEGAARIVDVCLSPDVESGQYWSKRAAVESTPLGNDAAKAEQLWQLSLQLTGMTPPGNGSQLAPGTAA